MTRLAAQVQIDHERAPSPSMVMVDAQTVRGGRYGPTFHNAGGRGGRTIGTKRTILVEILGLPLSARADPAKPHDVRVGRELLRERLAGLPRLRAIVADRGYRGLRWLADRCRVRLDIKAPPPGRSGFTPIAPLYKVEHTFAQLGRWRRLSRCYERQRGERHRLARGGLGRLPARSRRGLRSSTRTLNRRPSAPAARWAVQRRRPTGRGEASSTHHHRASRLALTFIHRP